MTHPVALPPLQPQWLDAFGAQSHAGLFTAPWLSTPTAAEIEKVQNLAAQLHQAATGPDDLTGVLGHLLEVRVDCLLASQTRDPVVARTWYDLALKACETALRHLHHAEEGTAGSLVRWVQGVHTLIQAQKSMPMVTEAERLARRALELLHDVHDPACSGADADASAALTLAREPGELDRRLSGLTDQVTDTIELYSEHISRQESLLNARLNGVRANHGRTFVAVVAWGALNIALMAALPLNGWLWPEVAWSLPFTVAVPFLWWWTWGRTFRDDLPFFGWVRKLRQESLAAFHEAAAVMPNPQAEFRRSVAALRVESARDRERMAAFCLFALPERYKETEEFATVAREGEERLSGTWMVELSDRHPWVLADALPVDPSMLPGATRIWYGKER